MTITDIKKINAEKGFFFFSKKNMRLFKSKIESGLYKNNCFITSECNFDGTKRFYTVRKFNPESGSIETIGEFQQFKTIDSAREFARSVE